MTVHAQKRGQQTLVPGINKIKCQYQYMSISYFNYIKYKILINTNKYSRAAQSMLADASMVLFLNVQSKQVLQIDDLAVKGLGFNV